MKKKHITFYPAIITIQKPEAMGIKNRNSDYQPPQETFVNTLLWFSLRFPLECAQSFLIALMRSKQIFNVQIWNKVNEEF